MDLYAQNENVGLPEIVTARLRLRAPNARDAAPLVKAINDYEVSKWLAVVPYPYDLADATWFISEVSKGHFTAWHIWLGEQLVGCIGVEDGSLGYWLAREFWGQGIATEAAQAIVDHYFAESGAEQMVSSYFVGNEGSCNVLTKLGFCDAGPKVTAALARGCDVQARRMVLTRADWQRRQNG